MPFRGEGAARVIAALMAMAMMAVPASAQRKLPRPDAAQDDLPGGNGPRGTSQAVPGELRYDDVGYAGVASDRGGNPSAITAAHRSLPAGSFAEVTALDSGRTILVMITGGGGANDRVIDLSPGAARLLAGDGGGAIAVRVRRVDPPGGDQQALREGRAASERIDSPPVLLTALRKRLPGVQRGAARGAGRLPALAPEMSGPGPAIVRITRPDPIATPPPSARGGHYVQVAALSNAARASALAQSLGGSVQSAGGIYRVRTGPYPDSASADRARDAAARRGYGDARITR